MNSSKIVKYKNYRCVVCKKENSVRSFGAYYLCEEHADIDNRSLVEDYVFKHINKHSAIDIKQNNDSPKTNGVDFLKRKVL